MSSGLLGQAIQRSGLMRLNVCLSRVLPVRHRIPTEQAVRLHENVNPARWCITFFDLKFFESEVHRLIQGGLTFEEDFSKDGPSIYALNEQYIKPITAAAGKMSWALMMNPDGLDCDLFITHAWQEGVFEFTQKVRTAWPWRARHAWCCMLANPQNLNISAMIRCPILSPFALALRSSTFLLVVPNRNASVYTRLWCGYEAYLAFQSGKIIQTARPPIWPQVLMAWFLMCPALLVGIIVGMIIIRIEESKTGLAAVSLTRAMRELTLLAGLISQNIGHNTLCLIVNHVGLVACLARLIDSSSSHPLVAADPLLPEEDIPLQHIEHNLLLFYFILAELDRVHLSVASHEADLLENQYQGSLRQACCSEIRDEMNIRSEIGDQVDEVDKVIQVLLRAGMTSDALRDAHMHGVVLEHAGVVQLAIPMLVLGPLLIEGFFAFARHIAVYFAPDDRITHIDWFHLFLQAVSCIARLSFVTLLWRRSADERCFMLNMIGKIAGPALFMATFLKTTTTQLWLLASEILYHLSFVVVCVFAFLGIRGTLKLPFGPWFAQIMLTRIISCKGTSYQRSIMEQEELCSDGSEASSSQIGGSFWEMSMYTTQQESMVAVTQTRA